MSLKISPKTSASASILALSTLLGAGALAPASADTFYRTYVYGDGTDIRRDVNDVRRDRQAIQADEARLAKDRAEADAALRRERDAVRRGDYAGAIRAEQDVRRETQEIAADRAKLARDEAKLNHDRRVLHRDIEQRRRWWWWG